jgi:hypothetical protein
MLKNMMLAGPDQHEAQPFQKTHERSDGHHGESGFID